MSKQWYNKNTYENYPSYLMGKKKKDNGTTKEFDNCRIRKYDFEGSPTIPYLLAPNQGVRGAFKVYGTSSITKNNILKVYASAFKNNPDLEIVGSVEVVKNGIIISKDTMKRSRHGYIEKTGRKPIGDAYVELPTTGRYEVIVLVSASIRDETGVAALNYEESLPYSL